MAWIFLSDSMLMPSLAPMDKADPKLTLGRRTMQVRGRLRSHLENFIENYGEGLDISEVEDTPFADYTCRFYATPEAFAEAMKRAMLDIDYRKFKDTAERPRKKTGKVPEKAKEYHSVLMTIWSATQRVGRAGGWYGAYSASNPRGYRPRSASEHVNYGGTAPRLGSTFLGDDDRWWEDDDFDYTPSREERIESLLEEVQDIPTDQWEDFLDPDEYELVRPRIPEIRRQERRLQRMVSRRNSRKKKGGRHRMGA